MFGNAESYQQFMGRWSRLVAPLLVDFSNLPDRGRILDVGSGTGSLSFAIAQRNPHSSVLGIDPSKEYVAYANSQNQFPGRAAFQLGDAQHLDLADATFEAAVSLLVFNFIPDPKKALLELRRVTKPGATISAAVWDYGDGMRMFRVFWDAAVVLDPAAGKYDERHKPLCRPNGLSDLWKQGGLDKIHSQPLEIKMKFKSFADYWEPFVRGQGPAGTYLATLDPAKRQALRSEIKRQLSVSAETEPFILPARVWAVRGTNPSSSMGGGL